MFPSLDEEFLVCNTFSGLVFQSKNSHHFLSNFTPSFKELPESSPWKRSVAELRLPQTHQHEAWWIVKYPHKKCCREVGYTKNMAEIRRRAIQCQGQGYWSCWGKGLVPPIRMPTWTLLCGKIRKTSLSSGSRGGHNDMKTCSLIPVPTYHPGKGRKREILKPEHLPKRK